MNPTRNSCTVDGCTRAYKAKGLCGMHYQRRNKRGVMGTAQSKRPRIDDPKEALMDKGWTVTPRGCWEWNGTNSEGRATVIVGGKKDYAYRVAYRLWNGPIPEGEFVCHRCDNPLCINPAHLFPGTHQDNVDDMVYKDRSKHGVRNHYAVLDEAQVREVHDLLAAKVPQAVIAERFNVARTTVSAISTGRSWRRVKDSLISGELSSAT